MKKLLASLLLIVFAFSVSQAQRPEKPNSADILQRLKKLNFLGTVLYVAAHPDDENTRMIAYMANEQLANTAYLSLTRGDGGQNLIGPEIREGLGVIRTQELLAARRIDGGRQFFTRANDFGYSKSTEETQKIWNRDQVLSDVVWVFRTFKPDVIITRFPGDGRGRHGHHTTSAIFAKEAFELAADKSKYSDQLKYTSTWQPKRLYTNTGRWWNPNITADTEGVITVDVGKYNPLIGLSYTELASLSRSEHKSQGFGSTGSRGEQIEFLEHELGPKADKNVFDGIDTSWKRVKGGAAIGELVDQAINAFDPQQPHSIVPKLIGIKEKISGLKDDYWKTLKTKEVDQLIKHALGLYLEVRASEYSVSPGDQVELTVEAVNRSYQNVKMKQIAYGDIKDSTLNLTLDGNKRVNFKTRLAVPIKAEYSSPYWLKEKGTLGTYRVDDRLKIGKPENDPAIDVEFNMEIEGKEISLSSPVIYKWNDPVDGELYRPFIITPAAFVNIPEPVYIFPKEESRKIELLVKSGKNNITGTLKLDLPKGWKCTPDQHAVSIIKKGGEERFSFSITPPSGQSLGELKASLTVNGDEYNQSLTTINYDHIPTQVIFSESKSRIVKIDLKKKGNLIGYIAGAADAIPAALREIGYEVWELNEEEITKENLSKLDALVLGIRAVNTNARIPYYMNTILDYVKDGGTVVLQYNTAHRLKTKEFSPYPIQLSRDRVTDEFAEVRILKKDHPIMNVPNKITASDFEGWVQERGLYFPNQWDDKYDAILSSNDVNEPARNGGLLVAKYGKGYYVYTGYSFFRELPAGVPGAFRLFVNMVSLGNENSQP